MEMGCPHQCDRTINRRRATSWRRWSSHWITASLLALVSVWLVGCLPQSPPAGNTPRAVPTDTPLPTPIPPRALAGTPYPQPAQPIEPGNAGRVTQLARWGKGTARTTAFSPDGQTLAVASSLGIYLHDAASLTEVRFIPTVAPVAHIAFSPNGRTIAFALFNDIIWLNDVIWLWDTQANQPLGGLKGHRSAVTDIAFAPDGRTLASGSFDYTVRLWDAQTGQPLRVLEGHGGAVTSVAFAPDGRTLASGGEDDDAVFIWDARTGQLVRRLEGHDRGVISIAFSPDGQTLASADGKGVIRLWDVRTGLRIRELRGQKVVGWAASPSRPTGKS